MVKLIRLVVALSAFAASLVGCAEPAPELPTGKTVDDVTWTDAGDMVVSGYCVTCGDNWCPGPEDCNGGGGNGCPYWFCGEEPWPSPP